MARASARISVEADVSRMARDMERAVAKVERRGVKFKLDDRAFRQPLGRITSDVTSFEDALTAANKRVIAFTASAGLILGASRAFGEFLRATVEVEKALKDINVIMNLSTKGLEKFSTDLFKTATATGQSFESASKAAVEFSRQGLSAEKTLIRVRDAMILTRLSGLEVTASVDALTAAVNGFARVGLDTTEVVNKLATVDAAFAVSSKDLAEALSRVGSSAQEAGVSFDQLLGLVTAAQQITARGGAVIGNSLKTIFTRVGREGTLDKLEELGVQVRSISGEARPAIEILKDLAKAYDGLTQSNRQQAAEAIGGVFQINQLKAVLSDLSRDSSIYAQASRTSAAATDEAIQRNTILNTSLSATFQGLINNAKETAAGLGEITFAPLLKDLAGYGNSIANVLKGSFADAGEDGGKSFGKKFLEGVGDVIRGPGLALFARIIAGVIGPTLRELSTDFKQVAGGSFFDKRDANTQKGINVLLRQATESERERYASAKNTTTQQQILLGILEKQLQVANALNAQQSTLSGAIRSSPVAPGFYSQVRRLGKEAGRYAGGYLPVNQETIAISRGIGGAPKNAKPVIIPDFNFGGGKRGDIVANTSEYLVRNFGGSGGNAIFNQDMVAKFGLPPNAEKIGAAGGFVPNSPSFSGKDDNGKRISVYKNASKQTGSKFISNTQIENVNIALQAYAESLDVNKKLNKKDRASIKKGSQMMLKSVGLKTDINQLLESVKTQYNADIAAQKQALAQQKIANKERAVAEKQALAQKAQLVKTSILIETKLNKERAAERKAAQIVSQKAAEEQRKNFQKAANLIEAENNKTAKTEKIKESVTAALQRDSDRSKPNPNKTGPLSRPQQEVQPEGKDYTALFAAQRDLDRKAQQKELARRNLSARRALGNLKDEEFYNDIVFRAGSGETIDPKDREFVKNLNQQKILSRPEFEGLKGNIKNATPQEKKLINNYVRQSLVAFDERIAATLEQSLVQETSQRQTKISSILNQRSRGLKGTLRAFRTDASSEIADNVALQRAGIDPRGPDAAYIQDQRRQNRINAKQVRSQRIQGGAFAAAFAAPLLAQFIPEDFFGGATDKIKSGIQGASSGAFFGSIFGPIGTALGAAGGGLIGALSTATDSLKKFAETSNKTNERLTAEANSIQQYQQTQELLSEAIKKGDNDAITRLSNIQSVNLSLVSKERRLPLLAAGFDQNKLGEIGTSATEDIRKENQRQLLVTATKATPEDFKDGTKARNIAALFQGDLKADDFDPNLLSQLATSPSQGGTLEFSNAIEKLVLKIIPESAIGTDVQDFNKKLREFVEISGRNEGLTVSQQNDLFNNLKSIISDSYSNFQSIINNIRQGLRDKDSDKRIIDINRAGIISSNQLKAAIEQATVSRQFQTIDFDKSQKIRSTRFNAGLGIGGLSDEVSNKLSNRFEVGQVRESVSFALQKSIEELRGSFSALAATGLSPEDNQTLQRASTLKDFSSLLNDLFKSDSKRRLEFGKLISNAELANRQGQALISIAEETAKISELQLKATEKRNLLEKGTFDAANIQSLTSLRGDRNGRAGDGFNRLISEQSGLSAVGIPTTNRSLDFESKLRSASVEENIREFLSYSLGREVSDITSANRELGQSGNAADQINSERIEKAIALLSFKEGEVRDSLIGNGDLSKLVSTGSLGFGDAVTATALATVSRNTFEANNILERIAFFAERAADARLQGELEVERIGLENKLGARTQTPEDNELTLERLSKVNSRISDLKEKSNTFVGDKIPTDLFNQPGQSLTQDLQKIIGETSFSGQPTLADFRSNDQAALGILDKARSPLSAEIEDLERRLARQSANGSSSRDLESTRAEIEAKKIERDRLSNGLGSSSPILLAREQTRIATANLRIAKEEGASSENISKLNNELALAKIEQMRVEKKLTSATERLLIAKQGVDNIRDIRARGGYVSGEEAEAASLNVAKEIGVQGDAKGSFFGGFSAAFEKIKSDLEDFSTIGNNIAHSINDGLGNAFGDFITGAKNGKDAFRDFATSVLSDAARAFASRAVQSLITSVAGGFFGNSQGGSIKRAMGGGVPSILTGGEYVFGPNAAKSIGPDTLRRLNNGGLNKYASGGMVRGGSGVRDDVRTRLAPGSFVVKKSAVQKYGSSYLDAIAKNQKRFFGGAILGALLGGGIGYATGGKKGAVLGALGGGITGGLAQNFAQTGSIFKSGGSQGGFFGFSKVGSSAGVVDDYMSSGYPGLGSSNVAKMSPFKQAAVGLGVASALGLAGSLLSGKNSLLKDSEIAGYASRLERDQLLELAKGRQNGQVAFLQTNPQGGQSLVGFGDVPATRRFAEGGFVDTIPMSEPYSPSNTPIFQGAGAMSSAQNSISISINIDKSGSQTEETSGNSDDSFARNLARQVQALTRAELEKQQRTGGMMSRKR